jgi:HlyD family secretion protein
MKKLIYLVVVIVVAVGGYYYYESQKPPQVPEFMKAAISEGNVVEIVSATGTLQADRLVVVGSKVSGVIEELNADFNDIVRAGQVLARINTDQLMTQVRIQEANISQREVDIENQRVQLADLKSQLARTERLYEAKLATEQQLEAARLQVSSREAQIESALKSKVSAEVNLEQAKLNVTEATIISPIDGVIVNRVVDRGQTIVGSQSATKFFDIATDLTKLRLEGGVDESEIGKVRTGMTVVFNVDAYPNVDFRGEITRVRLNPTVQSNVVTYTTVAEVRNNDLRLKPGMTANMRIEVSRKDNVVRIPNAALRFRPTNDMWTTLKQEPPAPVGRGGGARGGGPSTGSAQAPAAGTPAAGTPAAGTPAAGQPVAAAGPANPFNTAGGRTGGDRTAGGMGTGLTPEQQKAMEAIRQLPADQRAAAMARAGISMGGGRGRGGRGGNNGQTAPVAPLSQRGAGSIDELFPPLVRTPQRGQVYVLRPADATHPFGILERLDIMQGITDGTFTELVSGPAELTAGTELVTNILMPWLQTSGATPGNPQQGNPFSGQTGRGGGGRGR